MYTSQQKRFVISGDKKKKKQVLSKSPLSLKDPEESHAERKITQKTTTKPTTKPTPKSKYPSYYHKAPKKVKLPHKLKSLPYIHHQCLLDIKTVKIPGEPYPYNASILEYDDDSYLLFFRTDSRQKTQITTGIGYIHLDSNFEPTTKHCQYVNTQSSYPEDPRIFYHGNRLMITYNDLVSQVPNYRTIFLAEVSPFEPNLLEDDTEESEPIEDSKESEESKPSRPSKPSKPIWLEDDSEDTEETEDKTPPPDLKLEYIFNLDQHIAPVEKNWIPFIYQNQIYLQYYMNPHKILHIQKPREPLVNHLIYSRNVMSNLNFWKWGELRGGTPARLINGEYLAFFHSSFVCKKYGFYWYVMGAYTFEADPPFQITKISPHPIMYPTLYETKTNPNLDPKKRIIYPTGFAIRQVAIPQQDPESEPKSTLSTKPNLKSNTKTKDYEINPIPSKDQIKNKSKDQIKNKSKDQIKNKSKDKSKDPEQSETEEPKIQTLIHLSCGENDSAIKILTFDANRLIKSLRLIPPSTQPLK